MRFLWILYIFAPIFTVSVTDYHYYNTGSDEIATIVCDASAGNCTVVCDGESVCKGTKIICPTENENAHCAISCVGDESCYKASIYADSRYASIDTLSVDCNGLFGCYGISIYATNVSSHIDIQSTGSSTMMRASIHAGLPFVSESHTELPYRWNDGTHTQMNVTCDGGTNACEQSTIYVNEGTVENLFVGCHSLLACSDMSIRGNGVWRNLQMTLTGHDSFASAILDCPDYDTAVCSIISDAESQNSIAYSHIYGNYAKELNIFQFGDATSTLRNSQIFAPKNGGDLAIVAESRDTFDGTEIFSNVGTHLMNISITPPSTPFNPDLYFWEFGLNIIDATFADYLILSLNANINNESEFLIFCPNNDMRHCCEFNTQSDSPTPILEIRTYYEDSLSLQWIREMDNSLPSVAMKWFCDAPMWNIGCDITYRGDYQWQCDPCDNGTQFNQMDRYDYQHITPATDSLQIDCDATSDCAVTCVGTNGCKHTNISCPANNANGYCRVWCDVGIDTCNSATIAANVNPIANVELICGADNGCRDLSLLATKVTSHVSFRYVSDYADSVHFLCPEKSTAVCEYYSIVATDFSTINGNSVGNLIVYSQASMQYSDIYCPANGNCSIVIDNCTEDCFYSNNVDVGDNADMVSISATTSSTLDATKARIHYYANAANARFLNLKYSGNFKSIQSTVYCPNENSIATQLDLSEAAVLPDYESLIKLYPSPNYPNDFTLICGSDDYSDDAICGNVWAYCSGESTYDTHCVYAYNNDALDWECDECSNQKHKSSLMLLIIIAIVASVLAVLLCGFIISVVSCRQYRKKKRRVRGDPLPTESRMELVSTRIAIVEKDKVDLAVHDSAATQDSDQELSNTQESSSEHHGLVDGEDP